MIVVFGSMCGVGSWCVAAGPTSDVAPGRTFAQDLGADKSRALPRHGISLVTKGSEQDPPFATRR